MVFSSVIFLYAFLPLVVLGYYIINKKYKNAFLFVSSIIFFAWGGVSYSFILIFSIICNYFIGRFITIYKHRKFFLILGLVINLLVLIIFKYANFIIDNINLFFQFFQIPTVKNPSILLPVGISFYTFQSLSYLIDVYQGKTPGQKSFINLGLYISLFPQLIAGPIVRYHDIVRQITERKVSYTKFSKGAIRFCLGLAKKVIIANNLAYLADKIFSLQIPEQTMLYTWIGIIAYTFQIYYDFSGYSDMAIGLGRMFGFEILENFNFPYISKSIREFWRRWHISLSNWFRDYLYIPLGGNRKGKMHTYFNLLIVFIITGFWHGASWSFLIWGLLHGFFLVIERIGFENRLKRLPGIIQHSYAFIATLFLWVFFRSETLGYALAYIKTMIIPTHHVVDVFLLRELINYESLTIFILAILGAFNFFPFLYSRIVSMLTAFTWLKKSHISAIKTALYSFFIVIIMVVATTYLISGTYNPFIYYRF